MDITHINKDFKCKHPPKSERVRVKKKINQRKKKVKKQKVVKKTKIEGDFYSSDKWRAVRYKVLQKYSGECMCCGRSKKIHGVVIHVDHIRPRSKFPKLELRFSNLQLLCEDCNLGKSNKCQIDWRPDEQVNNIIKMELI